MAEHKSILLSLVILWIAWAQLGGSAAPCDVGGAAVPGAQHAQDATFTWPLLLAVSWELAVEVKDNLGPLLYSMGF